MTSMLLDPASPLPLYHQIAETLRYQIATARLLPGTTLPSVREGARIWGVNLHTVRRAYGVLADAGLIEISPPHAARVIGTADPDPSATASIGCFLETIVREAADKHGLTPRELAERLLDRFALASRPTTTVHVIECSEAQAAGHARELMAAFDVRAAPFSLEQTGDPPSGPLVGTYFHYNDIRVRWPERLRDVRFAGIQPDPAVARRFPRQPSGRRRTLYLCELDRQLAECVAADLSLLLPPERYRIVPEVLGDSSLVLQGRPRATFLFPPRAWHRLTQEQKSDRRTVEVRYVFAPGELDAVGRHFGWRRRP